ncbi:transposase [Streptomyces buecherae]|uniref:transposase n=1 Tax=Streptomyces buecherae TaxID=2763006 RepID=UPI001E39A069|nr:transposase [Streptomyces buecherae]
MFGSAASDSTFRRLLDGMDEAVLIRIARARGRVRRHVWSLLHLRRGGFPWLVVAGRRLAGWIVIDLDATIITSASKKQGARATFKKTYGFHPLGAWCANTRSPSAAHCRTTPPASTARTKASTATTSTSTSTAARSPAPRARSARAGTAPTRPPHPPRHR